MKNSRQRKKSPYLHLTLFLLLVLAPVWALAADKNISFSSSAEVERTKTNIKGEEVRVREPAELVEPGEVVIYTNVFSNRGTEPADELVINNPIPEDTEYLGGSATETGYFLAFSTDKGKSFGEPAMLTVPDDKGGKRTAEPKDYTDIRWTMQTPLSPSATGVVEFRVRVK